MPLQERIAARLDELRAAGSEAEAHLIAARQAEREAETRVIAIRTVLAELRALLQPEPIITTDEEPS